MDLKRWDPPELNTLREQMNRMWDFLRSGIRETGAPRIDVHQTADEVVTLAELPGIPSKDDIEVRVTNDSISIRGEFRRVHDVHEEDFVHNERFYGSFSRTLPLPVEVKPEEATGRFENGLLEVRIPKTEAGKKQKHHRVKIN
jgi:HSP20 family protein